MERETNCKNREILLKLIDMELLKIPSGKCLIGSTKKEVKDQIANNPDVNKRLFERQFPQHEIFLAEYKISKYPVVNEQFSKFVHATNYKTTAEKENFGLHFDGEMKEVKGANWKHPHGPESNINEKSNHPVVMVSWYDCIEFCKWLSKETKKKYFLPTEVEWEKAARGPNGNTWPWGNKWDENKCNCNNIINDTTPVGKYSPLGDSFYGCADMAGNILEWTSTTIGTRDPWPAKYKYPYDPDDGREDLKVNNRRIARGGTFQRDKDFCRCAFRFADEPENRYSSMGFRVVCK
jgi:sulfatase modifying factor 1